MTKWRDTQKTTLTHLLHKALPINEVKHGKNLLNLIVLEILKSSFLNYLDIEWCFYDIIFILTFFICIFFSCSHIPFVHFLQLFWWYFPSQLPSHCVLALSLSLSLSLSLYIYIYIYMYVCVYMIERAPNISHNADAKLSSWHFLCMCE